MKTYIVIFILFTVVYNCLASDVYKNETDLSGNDDKVIVLTPNFDNKKPLNESLDENKENVNSDNTETTTEPILCKICSPTVNLKGDECPKGYSRADDGTCQLEV
ncbi:unnamed protein product [Arctia plantaginis]|uniref:Uncharacterized protein n=1 Tax=Arctia plantaginis TaxID=874455 RepID=A0A8S0ZA88_ARCPL|nr:unnamed protein product [Arctia plantaginis]